MSCADVFDTICATDVAGWMMEGRTDCPGRLWNSTIIRSSDVLETLADGKTWATDYHFWSFTGNTADPANVGVPNKGEDCPPCNSVGQKSMTARKLIRTTCWGQEWLDGECNQAPEEEAEVIRGLIQDWSLDIAEMDLLHVLRGVYLNNVADDTSDLIYDASDAATNSEPNFMTKAAVLEAGKFLGCKRADLSALLVHEDVMISLEKRDLILMQEVNCDDGECIERAYFMGKEIYSYDSDLLTVNGDGTGGYLSVIFRPGAFGYGPGSMGERALGIEEEECADGGMGSIQYIPRDKYAIHPIGWDNIFDPAANANRTNMSPADLANPTSWCRVYDRKNVGMAFIQHTEAA